jgi:hypothetical protein
MKLVCISDDCLFKAGEIVYSVPQEPNPWLNSRYYYFKEGYWGPKECFITWKDFRKEKLEKLAKYESCLYK